MNSFTLDVNDRESSMYFFFFLIFVVVNLGVL